MHAQHCTLHNTQVVDIGGGLAANMKTHFVTPTFKQYATALHTAAPTLMHAAPRGRQLVTEFGRALIAKAAFTASVVEYVREPEAPASSTQCTFESSICGSLQQPECSTDSDAVATGIVQANATATAASADDKRSGVRTLVLHAGADLFPREVYTHTLYYSIL
jgi:hypothetical protein